MKKILFLILITVCTALFSSCGPHIYKTQSAGKDNSSYVIVLTDGPQYNNVSVMVDGIAHPYGKVYKTKYKRKAQPIVTEPGKHNIKVLVNGSVISDEEVYIGLQETKMVILR